MNLYCPEPLERVEIHPCFLFRFAPEQRLGGLFKDALPPNFFEQRVTYTDVAQASAIVLPNNFKTLDSRSREYIARYAALAHERRLPIFAFSMGDFTDRLVFDSRVQVFVTSVYRSMLQKNQILTPTLTEDLGAGGVAVRQKSDLPVVSFCGQAGYKTARQWIGYVLKNLYFEVRGFLNAPERAHKLGVYWRRNMMRACAASPLVRTRFIVRRSFSGVLRTIELDPAQARKEFVDSIRESDFVLAPKGDGNYSNRFLEVLSLGRIPVVADTDIVLPFEDIIAYAKIVVRVPMERVAETPRSVHEFYESLSEREWQERQMLACETFEKYLRQDSFFEQFFNSFFAREHGKS
ncbi:MAG: exostosin family protein [Patescibacteria group bacterium]|nr:exostosin family protein [Patescibacteria group bacterium]